MPENIGFIDPQNHVLALASPQSIFNFFGEYTPILNLEESIIVSTGRISIIFFHGINVRESALTVHVHLAKIRACHSMPSFQHVNSVSTYDIVYETRTSLAEQVLGHSTIST